LIAEAGSATTDAAAPRSIRVSTNMPGRSRPSSLASDAWITTFRVDSFTIESMAVIRPVSAGPAPSALTLTSPPTRSRVTSCWGTEKFT